MQKQKRIMLKWKAENAKAEATQLNKDSEKAEAEVLKAKKVKRNVQKAEAEKEA